MGLLYLPGDPGFEETLLTPRPDWHHVAAKDGDTYAFVVGSNGLACPVTADELDEYLEGGEYDERLADIDELE